MAYLISFGTGRSRIYLKRPACQLKTDESPLPVRVTKTGLSDRAPGLPDASEQAHHPTDNLEIAGAPADDDRLKIVVLRL